MGTIDKKLSIRPETVENVYDYYKNDQFVVNRRYQRKLVWTIEEKEAFIDSLSKNFPVPLFLVSRVDYKGGSRFEIIDGMQRLEAISSFIEGRISLDGKYFDLETFASTKLLLDRNILKQSTPKLDRVICKEIATYPLPLSVTSITNELEIDEIFRRINANGRHLSKQELRQVGSKSKFAELVKQIAENIRGDVSHSERLFLKDMANISINNRKLDYGINLGGIFWRKHNILTANNIRKSRDEELIAFLLACMLIKPRPGSTHKILDTFYGDNPDEGNPIIERKIEQHGFDQIKFKFLALFKEVETTLNAGRISFHKLLFKDSGVQQLDLSFQVIFLAFHDLIVTESMQVVDYQKLNESFKGIGETILKPNANRFYKSSIRENAVDAVKGIIRKCFVKRNETDPILSDGVVKLQSLLSRSKTENANYDFKIGLHVLYGSGDWDNNCFEKILKTLIAIANSGKGSIGYVVLGVADNKKDAERFDSFYNSRHRKYKDNFYITGLDMEAKYYTDLDDYRTRIEQKIETSSITPSSYKEYILRNMDMFGYNDKTVMILKVEGLSEPAEYDGNLYQRLGTRTKPVPAESKAVIWKNFIK